MSTHIELWSTSCSTSSCQSAHALMQIYINRRRLSLKAHTTSASSSVTLFLPQGLQISKLSLNGTRLSLQSFTFLLLSLVFLCVFCVSFLPRDRNPHLTFCQTRAVNLANLRVENGLYLLGRIVAFPFLTWHWQCNVSLRVLSKAEVPISQRSQAAT